MTLKDTGMAKTSSPSGRRPIDALLAPLASFMAVQAASGVLLLGCALFAIAAANSPWAEAWDRFWHTPITIGVGSWQLDESLLHWINDGLMTIFFFVVGLEIKRELVGGELSDRRKAALPLMAALGGMVVPAGIYLALVGGDSGARNGWGVPMATDIAFVVGFLALLGGQVPTGLKIFLLALAIVDDIGAILVIAVFYSSGVAWSALGMAAAGFGVILAIRWLGVRNVGVYTLVGAGIWLAMFYSGIHPTVAGVVLGLLTPTKAVLPTTDFVEELATAVASFRHDDDGGETHDHADHHGHGRAKSVTKIKTAATETLAPLLRLETMLNPWVAFAIMPLFALANAGVAIDGGALTNPVARSVAAGLVVGKPLGIVLFSWLAMRTGLARLPAGMNWRVLFGAGCLAGIGFTMSIFIASLGLEGDLLAAGKIGTLLGSGVSAVVGLGLLAAFLPKQAADARAVST
jgi:NhaA family Na+:H+ antiporter